MVAYNFVVLTGFINSILSSSDSFSGFIFSFEMFYLWLFLQAVIQVNSAQYEAECNMKLHNTTDEIGRIVFTSDQGFQTISGNFEADPEIIRSGSHEIQVNERPVIGNDCSAAITGARELELNSLIAGERGEINFNTKITVDPTKPTYSARMIQPDASCEPIKVKVYQDGREEPYVERRKRSEREMKKQKRKERKENGGKKTKNSKGKKTKKRKGAKGEKKCTKRRELKGKCTSIEDFFLVMEKMPDCYTPKRAVFTMTVDTPKFNLDGERSIVGRAIVLYDHSRTEDSAIACCTLELVKGATSLF